jgi:hypothetical protein
MIHTGFWVLSIDDAYELTSFGEFVTPPVREERYLPYRIVLEFFAMSKLRLSAEQLVAHPEISV